MRIYIAGPITNGDLEHNVRQATEAFVTLAKAGFSPWCPHWSVYSGPDWPAMPSILGCGISHAEWLTVDLAWITVADAVLRLPGKSTGADFEVAHAVKHGVPVYYDINDILQRIQPPCRTVVA